MVSKLGNTASFGSELRRVETAGNQQFGAQQEALTATIQARYDSLKMSYEKPNNSTIIGGDVAKDSTVDSQENESLIFFFHPDHLGSTSYVTGTDGTVAQHVEYIPYGEVFVEERSGTVGTAYLFNAKELDDETGMYYYGARYLDPTEAMWISVDPMWEKFEGMTAYNYCGGNPVKMVDPDGRAFDVSGNSDDDQKLFNESVETIINAGGRSGEYMKKLRDNPNYTVKVTVTRNDDNYFDPNKNALQWNPEIVLQSDKGYLTSPDVQLVHEVGHTYRYNEQKVQFYNDPNMPSKYFKPGDWNFYSTEDLSVELETEYAKTRGLIPQEETLSRETYGGTRPVYKTDSPHSIVPKFKPSKMNIDLGERPQPRFDLPTLNLNKKK